MKKTILVFLVFVFGIITTNASANTVTVHIDGVNNSGIEIAGFDFTFFSPDSSSFSWPVGMDENEGPPNFGSDFFVNGETSSSAGGFGLAPEQPYSGEYWYIDTKIDDDDYDGYEYVRGLGGFDDLEMPNLNKLNDGLLLTMNSNNTNFAIDISNHNTFLFDYNDEKLTESLKITESWTFDGDQIVTISPVPIPATAFLFASGFLGLIGIRRKFRK